MAGGLAPIKDVPKTPAHTLLALQRVFPGHSWNRSSRPPSAEARPGQLDSDLPDYDEL